MNIIIKITLSISLLTLTNFQAYAQEQTPDQIVSDFFQTLNTPAAGALQKPKPNRSLTPMLMYAKTNWNQLSTQTQTSLQPWFMRPTDTNATAPISGITLFTQAQESIFNSTYFRFHYLDAATNSTDSNAATLGFVQQLAVEADKVWGQEVITMGYIAPPSDGILGGDAKYDIYLLDIGAAGIYGYVTSDATAPSGTYPSGVYSYMVVDNDFATSQFGYTNTLTPAQVTLAHEFFHSIQVGYDGAEFPAFMESLSTWMEDKVYPTIKDNLQYIGEAYIDGNNNGQYDNGESFTDRNGNNLRESGSQDYPELKLESFGRIPSGLEQYGRFLWIRYLSEKFTDTAVLNILHQCGLTSGNNTYSAVDSVLINNASSLSTAFHEYGSWIRNVSQYANGADYPIAWVDNTFDNGAINISSNASVSLQPFAGKQEHLSTLFQQVNSPAGTYTFTSSSSTAKLTVMTHNADGSFTNVPVSLNAGSGSWAAPASTARVTFVISNTSTTDDTMTWQLTDGVTAPMPALTSNTTTFSTSSGGCLSPLSLPNSLLWTFLLLVPLLLRIRQKDN